MFIYSAMNDRHGPFTAVEETEILFHTQGTFDYHVDDSAPTLPLDFASADFRPVGRNGTINIVKRCGAIRMARETCWARSAAA